MWFPIIYMYVCVCIILFIIIILYYNISTVAKSWNLHSEWTALNGRAFATKKSSPNWGRRLQCYRDRFCARRSVSDFNLKYYLDAGRSRWYATERLIDKRGNARERCPNNECEPVVGVWKRKWVQAGDEARNVMTKRNARWRLMLHGISSIHAFSTRLLRNTLLRRLWRNRT